MFEKIIYVGMPIKDMPEKMKSAFDIPNSTIIELTPDQLDQHFGPIRPKMTIF